ncbi:reverse transcriptase-like protein [Alkalihalobacillus sp. LMS39]|uniref:reverse transcriptase-like protein n=1 Tax=Alkalihalobacillus sp. LMS39 TaxID=2924032 RepID=UPI001FB203DD|nr:reverse transcriptase-like protein [Alkalihalobacillus sp. LMS39]UOE92165.1 reverse transcriptase-like protein [Alkalihalobacillus sp. LMS39]
MIEVYIDGASAGNPGPSGAGIFMNYKNGQVERHSIYLGEMSNHEAEYMALIHALTLCVEQGIHAASFRTDSKLIDDAVEKRFVKKEKYKALHENAMSLIDQFDLFFMKWIPSNQNKNADELARLAIRKNQLS